MDAYSERRFVLERRVRDVGPPSGCADRRRLPERRVPRLPENAISDAEWQHLFGVAAGEREPTPR